MTYHSARHPLLIAALCALCLLLAAAAVLSVLYLDGILRILLLILDFAMVVLLLWILLSTQYSFTDTALILKSGPFRNAYAYEEIKTALRTRGYSVYMTLDFDRLELNQGLHPEQGRILLSPAEEDAFLEELARRCPGLKIE